MASYKIKVIKNIGESSEYWFGKPGTLLHVVNGELIGMHDCPWYPDEGAFEGFDSINNYFSEEDEFQTVFELVKEGE